ncbi:DUF1002 domain-containing protein [Priestia flexa]|uniref:DUF1002 domain-containing protein n=2 Tax=Priestia TaxID=2800373 RepID=A0A0V8JSC6_9BACI|nr:MULTISPECIES: DUF1002 domain-containing protein [Bacillaceae]AQX53865.1 hypothetical protein BC359_05835 [Priestia flexa]KSU89552.1 hypothetical protein AS180_01720 [Priestia veravalensis]KZB90139.1 hypothetical protein A2U94_17480 [Bacillus sp. VT 712]MBN8250278.1 DUF1002 domain-containing protein [Priestia flexa]MBN8432900.1 DUF1002 domain-containing protein [Priestia flexa]
MKPYIKIALLTMSLILFLTAPIKSLADAAVGDVIVTLGEDLTIAQKEKVLKDLEAPDNAQTITVSNAEEHEYLGDFIPKATIGSRAISSSSITLTAKDSGLSVATQNITSITDDMYLNALMTAGVKDADIKITAPFEVSGTAALTGIMKAYEVQTNKKIPEEVKKAANEEMVQTAELGEKVGKEKAAEFMATIKEEIAKENPQTKDDLRALIERVANDLGISLTDSELNTLVDFFNRLKDLDIDWNQVKDQLSATKEKVTTFLQSEEGQSFLDKLKNFFISIIDAIKALFS